MAERDERQERISDALAACDVIENTHEEFSAAERLPPLGVIRRVLRRALLLVNRSGVALRACRPVLPWMESLLADLGNLGTETHVVGEADDPPAVPDNPVPGPSVKHPQEGGPWQ